MENSMDRGAWWSTVHGVTKNQTQLNTQHTHTGNFAGDDRVSNTQSQPKQTCSQEGKAKFLILYFIVY